MKATTYGVSLSESGLLIELQEFEEDGRVSTITLIDRSAWPGIVDAVAAVIAQAGVVAEAENIVDRVLYGDD